MARLETNVELRRIVNLYNLLGRNTSMLVFSTEEYFAIKKISLRVKCTVVIIQSSKWLKTNRKKTEQRLFLRILLLLFAFSLYVILADFISQKTAY